jgi:hypothetical protein
MLSTFLQSTPLERPKEQKRNWKCIRPISFRSVLIILIYWGKMHHKESKKALLDASTEVGLKVTRRELSIYSYLVIRLQDKVDIIKVANNNPKIVAKFKYLGLTVTNKNCTQVK